MLDAELFVFAYTPAQRTLVGFYDVDGTVVVPAYTSKSLAPRDWPHARAVRGRDIIDLLGGHPLVLNPDDAITAVVTPEELARVRARRL